MPKKEKQQKHTSANAPSTDHRQAPLLLEPHAVQILQTQIEGITKKTKAVETSKTMSKVGGLMGKLEFHGDPYWFRLTVILIHVVLVGWLVHVLKAWSAPFSVAAVLNAFKFRGRGSPE